MSQGLYCSQTGCIIFNDQSWEGNTKLIALRETKNNWHGWWHSQVCDTKPEIGGVFQTRNCPFTVEFRNAQFSIFITPCWLCTSNFYISDGITAFFLMKTCILGFSKISLAARKQVIKRMETWQRWKTHKKTTLLWKHCGKEKYAKIIYPPSVRYM